MSRWEDGVTPRYGWEYRGEGNGPGYEQHIDARGRQRCAMCAKAAIKFVHAMWHPEHQIGLAVGSCCGAQMLRRHPTEDYRDNLGFLGSLEKRRKRWLTRKWWLTKRDNYRLRVRGWLIVVWRATGVSNQWGWYMTSPWGHRLKSTGLHSSLESAKLETFDFYVCAEAARRG